jgi:hypothetical protein
MGLPRSTYYDAPSRKADDAEIIATMMAICDEFEVYGLSPGWRRAAPSRHNRQFQEGPPPHARARPVAQAPAAVYGHDRQRSRQSDLSGSCA